MKNDLEPDRTGTKNQTKQSKTEPDSRNQLKPDRTGTITESMNQTQDSKKKQKWEETGNEMEPENQESNRIQKIK